MRFVLLLLFASPLWGQATPSIQQGSGERRDVVSLREYMDVRFTALEAKIDARNQMSQLAIDKAEATMNDRLSGMNEFRDQLKDQAGLFATKEEVNKRAEVVDQRIGSIENQISSLNGSLKIFGLLWVLIQAGLGIWFARMLKPPTRVPET